jgi:hypothetical protein
MLVLLLLLNCLRPKPKNHELQITTEHGKEQKSQTHWTADCHRLRGRESSPAPEDHGRRLVEDGGAIGVEDEESNGRSAREGGNIRGEAEDRRKEARRWRESSRNRLRKFLRRCLTVQNRSCGECLKLSRTCNCQWTSFIPLFCFV